MTPRLTTARSSTSSACTSYRRRLTRIRSGSCCPSWSALAKLASDVRFCTATSSCRRAAPGRASCTRRSPTRSSNARSSVRAGSCRTSRPTIRMLKHPGALGDHHRDRRRRVGFVDAGDIARVAVEAVLSTEPLNTDLIVTGPETLSYDDVAEISARPADAGSPMSTSPPTSCRRSTRPSAYRRRPLGSWRRWTQWSRRASSATRPTPSSASLAARPARISSLPPPTSGGDRSRNPQLQRIVSRLLEQKQLGTAR